MTLGSPQGRNVGPRFYPRPIPDSMPPSLSTCFPTYSEQKSRELWARESPAEWQPPPKTPPGPIKCLINSRRRIGRNNEHLSAPFIAYKTFSPAFFHLIFATGPGGRYYHYLHFVGEESQNPSFPSLGLGSLHTQLEWEVGTWWEGPLPELSKGWGWG